MSELDAVKARAAAACDDTTPVILEDAFQIMARSQADVPKLVALIEKIRDEMDGRATAYETTADRLWKQIETRDPERNLEEAQRYGAYATNARAAAYIIDKTIKEGLTE